MNKKEKLIWSAGFIDGEGSLMIKRYKCKTCRREITFQPVISCAQTVQRKEPIYLLQKLFNGSVSFYKQVGNRYDTITWTVASRDAEKCARELLPYLIVKKRNAKVIINYYNGTIKKGSHITDKEWKRREELFWKMRKFNSKGCLRLKRLNEETPKGDATV